MAVDPSREHDFTNLLPLCESYEAGVNCHLFFGHGGLWTTYNPHALQDAYQYRAARILRVSPHPLN